MYLSNGIICALHLEHPSVRPQWLVNKVDSRVADQGGEGSHQSRQAKTTNAVINALAVTKCQIYGCGSDNTRRLEVLDQTYIRSTACTVYLIRNREDGRQWRAYEFHPWFFQGVYSARFLWSAEHQRESPLPPYVRVRLPTPKQGNRPLPTILKRMPEVNDILKAKSKKMSAPKKRRMKPSRSPTPERRSISRRAQMTSLSRVHCSAHYLLQKEFRARDAASSSDPDEEPDEESGQPSTCSLFCPKAIPGWLPARLGFDNILTLFRAWATCWLPAGGICR